MSRILKVVKVNPDKIEAFGRPEGKVSLDFTVRGDKGDKVYAVIAQKTDILTALAKTPVTVPEHTRWVDFSEREPHREGSYVLQYENSAYCTFPTLASAIGAYHQYGAYRWLLLPE